MKTSNFIVALTLFLFAAMPTFAQVSGNYDAAYYFKEEQFAKALEVSGKMAESAEKQILVGKINIALNQTDKAKESFAKAAVDVKNLEAQVGLIAVELKSGSRDIATVAFDKILKSNKKNFALRESVIRYCLTGSKSDTALARRYLNDGLAINYKYAPYQVLSGIINLNSNKIGPAISDFERAILFDAQSVEAYRNLGFTYLKARDYRNSLSAFQKGVEIDVNQILVFKGLGDLYYTFGKYPESEAAFKTYIDRGDASVEDLERYAYVLFFNKKYDNANAVLDQIISKSSSQAVIYRLKGYMAYEKSDYAKGIEYMETFFAKREVSGVLASDFGYYARLLTATKQDSLAMVNYEKSLVLDSTNVNYLNELAKLYSVNKKQLEAVSAYQRLINNNGDKATMSFNIGKEYYYKADEYRAKRDEMLVVLNNKPNASSDSLNVLMTKYFIESRNAFDVVVSLSPDYYLSYIWKGRIETILDPESLNTLAKENYEKAASIIEAGDAEKRNKKMLIECYRSLGSYYFLNFERSKGAEAAAMKATSLSYFEKISALDPADQQIKDIIASLKTK